MNNMYKLLCIKSPDHHLKFALCVPLCQVLKVCIPDYEKVPQRPRENRRQIVFTLPFSV